MMECEKCGQTVDVEDMFIHTWVRHGRLYTKRDFETAEIYFNKYPEHKYDRAEWLKFIESADPDRLAELSSLEGKEFAEWCEGYATYYAEKMKQEAREKALKHVEGLMKKVTGHD